MRTSLQQVVEWVNPGARVLDLGCGDGTLLDHLQRHKQCTGYGLEIDRDCIIAAVARGVNAIEQNLDDGLAAFDDKSFDTVVMTQALQATRRPDLTLAEMLRIGHEASLPFLTLPTSATAFSWAC